jgi:putative Holliday junction resolvase
LSRQTPRKKRRAVGGPTKSCAILGAKHLLHDLTINDTTKGDANRGTPAPGRLLALDLGARRVGVAVCDEMRISVRVLPAIRRSSWKKLVSEVARLAEDLGAAGLVVGLPLRLDGTEGDAALEARRLAHNFELTLRLPIHLQDERLTTRAANEVLRDAKVSDAERALLVDSEAAAAILSDFISRAAVNVRAPHD